MRITAEDIGWPVGEGTPGTYEYTLYEGLRLVPSCILQPYYLAKKMEIAHGR